MYPREPRSSHEAGEGTEWRRVRPSHYDSAKYRGFMRPVPPKVMAVHNIVFVVVKGRWKVIAL